MKLANQNLYKEKENCFKIKILANNPVCNCKLCFVIHMQSIGYATLAKLQPQYGLCKLINFQIRAELVKLIIFVTTY